MLNELFYRLALQYQTGLGFVTIKKMIQLCGSATAIFENKALLKKHFYSCRNVRLPSVTASIRLQVMHEYEKMEKNDLHLCFYTDENYPKRLKNCNDAPTMFFYKGNADFNRQKVIAVVGTRNASNYGTDAVKKIITELAPYDVSVVSGLAKGIDTAAHEQAIENRLNTVAVMGSGFSKIYPYSNRQLSEQIVDEGGSLVSEYLYDVLPEKQNFPRRNRIIAGMADATIVAETASKGGSIITAFIAHSYNRDVFAVPGSIFAKSQEGCHELIRTNMAALVCSGKQLVEMMNWDTDAPPPKQQQLFPDLSDNERFIFNLIRANREINIDAVLNAAAAFSPSQVANLLLRLELNGLIESKPGKIYTTIY